MALVALALVVQAGGGFRVDVPGVRVGLTSPWRVLVWAALILAVRHAITRMREPWPRDEPSAETAGAAERAVPDRAVLAAAILFFIATTVLMLLPQVLAPFSVPDQGDPLFSMWRLSWVAHQLPRDPLHLFDANIFHPNLRTLAYSDAMLLPAAFGAPLLWLGLHQVLAYDIIFLASITSSGVATFLLVRRLTARSDAALVSGVLFAFCAFRFAHYSHLELQVTPWMPLGLLWFHRLAATHRLRDGLLTGLAVALQGLSSLYFGIFFACLLVCLAVVSWATGLASMRRTIGPLAAGALLAIAVLGPVTVPYLQNRAIVGERGETEVRHYSAVPGDYLVPNRHSIYQPPQQPFPSGPERELFPGFVPVALAAAGLVPPLSAVRLAYASGLALGVDASFGLNGFVYPFLYRYVLPFRGLRAPARFGVIVALALSVLAGFGVARILRLVASPGWQRAIVGAVVLTALVEARPVVALQPIAREPPRIYAALPAGRVSVLAELPFPTREEVFGHDFTFEYFSTFHWNRIVNGATGVFPPDYLQLLKVMYGFPSDAAMSALRERGVEFLVIHGEFYQPGEFARVIADLDRRPSLRLVSVDRSGNGEARLYQLSPVSPSS